MKRKEIKNLSSDKFASKTRLVKTCRGGLMYDITAVKCCMVCVRSQVRIPLGTPDLLGSYTPVSVPFSIVNVNATAQSSTTTHY